MKSRSMLERVSDLQKGHLRTKDTKVLPTRQEQAYKVVRIDDKVVRIDDKVVKYVKI